MVVLYNRNFNIIFYVAGCLGFTIIALVFIYLFALLVRRSKHVNERRLRNLEDLENTKRMNKIEKSDYIKTHMIKHIIRDDSSI